MGMRKHAGFTLLELMVVVAIIALTAGAVSLALPPAAERQLAQEAQRLSALLERARAQSRASGQVVVWRASDAGFAFQQGTAAVRDADQYQWLHPGVTVRPHQLWLGPEPVIAAQRMVLTALDGRSVALASDGVRPFAVQWEP